MNDVPEPTMVRIHPEHDPFGDDTEKVMWIVWISDVMMSGFSSHLVFSICYQRHRSEL